MKTFLLAHRGALGDFVLTWPAWVLLRWKYSQHRFVAVGRPDYLRLAVEMGLVDQAFDSESADMLPLWSGENIPASLGRVDAALMWTQEDAELRRLLTRQCTGPVHIHAPFPGNGEHVMDYHLQILPYFSLPAIAEEDPYFPLDSRRESYALIHPGSGSPDKNYDPEFYAFLANELRSKRFPDVRIVLGPAEKHLESVYQGRFSVETPHNAVELARLLSRAKLFIGNDSGPSHLAALLGTKTLALFRQSHIPQWGVRGHLAQNLEAASEAQAMTRIQKALSDS